MLSSETIALATTIFSGFGGLIWKIAKAEEQILDKICKNHTFLLGEINNLRHELEKIQIINQNDHENFLYRDNSLLETVNHKFKRMESWIDQISKYLEKNTQFMLNKSYFNKLKEEE